jgi:hypothetical protein
MFLLLDDEPPIAGDYGSVRAATGTMGDKRKAADHAAVKASLEAPNFLLKIIPHVDPISNRREVANDSLNRFPSDYIMAADERTQAGSLT